ncbi:MAG TPA: hypothetical protein VKH19_04525 [Gemmatimonadaceae bacterium]|nr:hypothetical protein [Gemmatimonadaceae bacterium]
MTDFRLVRRGDWRGMLALVIGWSAALLLAWHYLDRGWVPHDEGTLAQSAERWLRGELPHRDFDEIYTGGLSALHALAFRVFGDALSSMRIPLLAAFAAFLPAVFYVARQFAPPVLSALVMVVAAAWTLPNYSAPIPSWYNLFLATLGMACLVRFVHTGARGWVFAAGLTAGLSCLAKTPGLYFAAAAFVFLLYHEDVMARAGAESDASRTPSRMSWFDATRFAALALLGLAVTMLVRERAGFAGFITFVAPILLLLVAIALRLSRGAGAPVWRLRRLGGLVLPFALGVIAPIIVFVVPYAASGSLGALWTGVFVLPLRRFTFAAMDLLPLWTWMYGAAVVALFWWGRRSSANARVWAAILVGVVVAALLLRSRYADPYEIVWYALRSLLPLSVIGGAALLATPRAAVPAAREEALVLLLAVTSLCALVQFPFAAPVYFLYVAPFALLSAVALSRTWDPGPQPAATVLLVFLLLFAVLRVNPGFIYAMGVNYVRDRQTATLTLPRGGVRVTPEDSATYEETIATVRTHARGEYIWAGPDAPEAYFLSGTRNPTRTLFDFFDSPTDRTARVLAAIETHDVRVVVLHSRPPFSGPLPVALRDSLMIRFPHSETHGWFETRWRE